MFHREKVIRAKEVLSQTNLGHGFQELINIQTSNYLSLRFRSVSTSLYIGSSKDMSCDTVKEIASVVDSSSEWKQDNGNLDDPVSSSYKEHEDRLPRKAKERGNAHDHVRDISPNNDGRLYGTRYFIIKSLNHQNLQLSIDRGIWATQVMNEPILDEAFHKSRKVILIFSVNMSGFFQGYAQMMSSVGWRRDSVWSQGYGGGNPWGRNFKVKWLCLRDLPFQKTLHLRNPLNEFKPVKISRDCQELPEDIGEALCELLNGNLDADGELKGNELFHNNSPLKRPFIEPPGLIRDNEYGFPPTQMNWERTHMPHPFLYPLEADFSHPRSHGVYPPENFPITSLPSTIAHGKQSRSNGRLDHDMSTRSDIWGLSAEESPLSTLTDDEFLEMSYEEYLKIHSKSLKHNPVAGKSKSEQEPSNKQHDDESCSRSSGDRYNLNKRSRHSIEK